MPGVPSGRGCEACRKQKKKCDEGQPSCSRCTRLQIPCVGSGQKRYKFKAQNLGVPDSRVSSRSPEQGEGSQARVKIEHDTTSSSPTSSLSTASSSHYTLSAVELAEIYDGLVRVLAVRDVRYDLRRFGSFVEDVPQLLGVNEALDTAVRALTAAHATLHINPQPVSSLARYINAIHALRECLADPSTALTIHTMVAIYFVMICQSFTGTMEDTFMNHGRVLAHLLQVLSARGANNSLEARILCTMSIPVVWDKIIDLSQMGYGILSPTIRIGPELWQVSQHWRVPPLIECAKSTVTEALKLPFLWRAVELINDPEGHYAEMFNAYTLFKEDTKRLTLFTPDMGAVGTGFSQGEIARNDSCIATLSAFTCILNAILRVFHPGDEALLEDAREISRDVLQHGQKVMGYRPLGSSYMSCNITAAMVFPVPEYEAELREMLLVYESDFTDMHWLETAAYLERRFRKIGPRDGSGSASEAMGPNLGELAGDAVEPTVDDIPVGACAVM